MAIGEYPDANYTPTMAGYSGQGSFRFWCQTVLPLVYDDSLSYYELLNKVVNYLNNTIADVAAVEGNVDSLLNAYNSLQEYVNTYFDSLDVQEEINNKLDEMASDGSLNTIIDPVIAESVSDWLDENLTPTSPPVDSTLTVSGAAADAKVTGDKIDYRTLRRIANADYVSAETMPNNTYMTGLGSIFVDTLGENFTWNLLENTTYRLEKFANFTTDAGVEANSISYRLTNLSGSIAYGGSSIVVEDVRQPIIWSKINTNETEFNGRIADIENLIDYRTLKRIANADYTNAIDMPNNTYMTGQGSIFVGTLGNNFTWNLASGGTYRLEKFSVYTTDSGSSANTVCYRLYSVTGSEQYGGYTIASSTDIGWAKINTNETEFNNILKQGTVNYSSSNYNSFPYVLSADNTTKSVNAIKETSCYTFGSDITEEMVTGLPSYGSIWTVFTLRGQVNNNTSSNSNYNRLQLAWTTNNSSLRVRRICFRVSVAQVDTGWGDWLFFGYQDGLRPVYVALGTSVTKGQIRTPDPNNPSSYITTYATNPYPDYIGKLHDYEYYNLGQNGTGLVNRGTSDNLPNFMDTIYNNQSLIARANLITIEWGGNDQNLLVDETNPNGRFGEYTDYFRYEDYMNDYAGMCANATEMGALNWCLEKIFSLNQTVTVILICGPGQGRYYHVTFDKVNGTVAYSTTLTENSWSNKCVNANKYLTENARIPTINCDDGFPGCAYNNSYDSVNGFWGSDGVHPTDAGYTMKARYLNGEIGKFFNNT